MIRSFLWDFIGKAGTQVTSFIVSIVLTRILQPEEYGIMGMAMVIIAISATFLNLGFSTAIVQQKEITEVQTSTVFFINLCIGVFLFLLCFALSGVVAEFYALPAIKPIFRVLSVTFLLNALNLVPSAILYRQMKFNIIARITLLSTVTSGIISIVLAYMGYGVWSLVVPTLIGGVIGLLLTQYYVRFKPLLIIDIHSVRPLWNYGSKLFASGLLDTIFTRIDIFIIGKLFKPATVGLYSRAQTMDGFVRQISSGSLASVLFPFLAKNQDNLGLIRAYYIRYLHLIMFLAVGLSGILYVTAEDLFIFLFSERWLISGSFFKIMALASFIWPVSSLMCTLISAMGNSSAFLRLEVLKKILIIPVYAFGFFWGIEGFIYLLVSSYYGALILNMLFVQRQTNIQVGTQILIITKYLIPGIISALAGFFVLRFWIQDYSLLIRLLGGGGIFIFTYVTIAILLQLPAWSDMNNLQRKIRKKIS